SSIEATIKTQLRRTLQRVLSGGVQQPRKKRRKAEQSCPKITVAFTNRSYGSSPDDDQSSTSNKRWINEQDLT
uniref:Uncharacterized protein n=1 Tax=Romanomermis culicivorax TaxID=13658 RepID=A0A915KUA2_ROMCU